MWQQLLLGAVEQVLLPEALINSVSKPGLPTHSCRPREMYPHVSRKAGSLSRSLGRHPGL